MPEGFFLPFRPSPCWCLSLIWSQRYRRGARRQDALRMKSTIAWSSTTLADFERRGIPKSLYSVTHGWSAFGGADHGWHDSGLPRRARTASPTIDQRQVLAALGKEDAAVSDILDGPAIVEKGALVVAATLGRDDVGVLAEPHGLHIDDRQRLGFRDGHVRDKHQPPAIGLIKPLLRFRPGGSLFLHDAAGDDDLSTRRAHPQTGEARHIKMLGELARGVLSVVRGC